MCINEQGRSVHDLECVLTNKVGVCSAVPPASQLRWLLVHNNLNDMQHRAVSMQ